MKTTKNNKGQQDLIIENKEIERAEVVAFLRSIAMQVEAGLYDGDNCGIIISASQGLEKNGGGDKVRTASILYSKNHIGLTCAMGFLMDNPEAAIAATVILSKMSQKQ